MFESDIDNATWQLVLRQWHLQLQSNGRHGKQHCPLPASPLTKFSLSDRKFRYEIRDRSSGGGLGSTGFWSTCRTGHALRDAKTLAGVSSLSADELRRAVTGKTVYLDVSGFELPIRYLDNGRMSGTMGAVAATLSIGDPVSDKGVGGSRPTSFASGGQAGWQ